MPARNTEGTAMLVLGRKEGEAIDIGNDVRITVVAVRHGRVDIGIQAPRDTRVLRTELTREQNRESHR